MKKLAGITFVFLFFFTSFIRPQDQPLPVDKDVVTGTLDNGLKYYIQKNHKPEKRAELRLFVNAGSVLEDDNQCGLAHLVEHMAFNGTKNFKKQELVDYLEKLGIKFGPELNAYTSFDQTVYMLTVPTDSAGVLATGFAVLEDWAHNLSFDPEEIDKERGVVIEEWRLGRGAQMRMLDKQLPIMLKGSLYADRLTIGKKEIIESADYETIKKFYHDWYRPDLLGVAAVGDFDVNTIESLIKDHFSNLISPEVERERKIYEIPKHDDTYFAVASDKEAMYTYVSLYYTRDPEVIKTADDYRKMLAHQLFYGILNDRLRELTLLSDAPFAYAQAGSQRFVKAADISYLVAMVGEGGVNRGLESLLREAERIKQFGVASTELDRQKTAFLRGAEKRLDEKDKTESLGIIGQMEANFLYGDPLISVDDYYSLAQQIIPSITLEEVNKVAAGLLDAQNRVVLVNTPDKEGLKIPGEAELASVINKVNEEQLTAYVDKVSSKALVENPPVPSPVVATERDTLLGIVEWKLGNGVKVILKPTDFKNDEIVFSAFSPGGSSLVPDRDFMSGEYASELASESGLAGFSMPELQKYLTGKLVRVSPYIGFNYEGFNGAASPKDVETLFQLIYSWFTSPQIDSSGYASIMNRLKSYLQNRSSDPEAAFDDTMQVTLSNYHFRSRPFTMDMLDEINPEKALNIFRDRFKDAGDFTFIFTGNLDTAALKPVIENYLGGLPSIGRIEAPVDLKYKDVRGEISKAVHKGIEPKSSVKVTYVGNMEFSRKNEQVMQSLVDVLNIKLREAIREDKSGTYGVSVFKAIYRFPRAHYDLNFEFGCSPDRVDELTKTFFSVLDSIKTFGPDETVMTKVKEIQKRQLEIRSKQNGYWMGMLADYLQNNDDPDLILNYNQWINSLTADDIKQSANQYLGKDVVKVVLYPAEAEHL